jgi:hypothetical protein
MSYLPFYDNESRNTYGSCEIFEVTLDYIRAYGIPAGEIDSWEDEYPDPATASDEELQPYCGFYWQASFPGCIPDGCPSGPYPCFTLAAEDAGCLRILTLPASWSSALIDGDYGDMDKEEIGTIERILRDEKVQECEGIVGEDSADGFSTSFTIFHDAQGYGIAPCDCYNYIFPCESRQQSR